MENMKDKISVIVPVYNVEQYLERCVNSIINQTYNNIEILLIDDGSKDKSGIICDNMAQIDSRIKVIHKENGGLSSARNAGIDVATGEYYCFIDSDDYIELDMIEYLYEGIIMYDSKIVACGLTDLYDNGNRELITIPKEDKTYDIKDALDIHLFPGYIEDITCNKIFHKSLYENIRYPIGLLYEDMMTTYKLIDKSNKVVLRPKSKYIYYKRPNSIGRSAFSEKTLKLVEACDEAVNYVIDKYPEVHNIFISQIHWYIVVANKMILADKVDYKFIKKIKRLIKKNFLAIIKSKYCNTTRKLQFILFYISLPLYKIFYKKFLKKYR